MANPLRILSVVTLILVTCMSNLDAFKAHVEYYDQIYLNTTNWNIQVTYDYSKLENAGTELYEFCRDAPKQLAIIRKEIQSNNVIKKIEGKLSVTPTYDTFYRGKELCSELGPMCRMASIGSQDELHEITKLMRSTNADQAYVDFGTDAGDSYLDGKEPEPTNFLATETVFSTLSSPEFTLTGIISLILLRKTGRGIPETHYFSPV